MTCSLHCLLEGANKALSSSFRWQMVGGIVDVPHSICADARTTGIHQTGTVDHCLRPTVQEGRKKQKDDASLMVLEAVVEDISMIPGHLEWVLITIRYMQLRKACNCWTFLSERASRTARSLSCVGWSPSALTLWLRNSTLDCTKAHLLQCFLNLKNRAPGSLEPLESLLTLLVYNCKRKCTSSTLHDHSPNPERSWKL